MKNYLLPALFYFSIFISQAQIQMYQNRQAEQFAPNANMVKMKEGQKIPVFIKLNSSIIINNNIEAINYSKALLKNDRFDFQLYKEEYTSLKENLYRYVQTIDGYPVEFTQWKVLQQGNRVEYIFGDITSQLPLNTSFGLSESEALQKALNFVNAEEYMWEDTLEEQSLKERKEDNIATYYPQGSKIVTPNKPQLKDVEFVMAYKFNIYSKKPYDRQMVYVDANTGEILFTLPLLHFDNEIGIAHTGYSGIQQINTFSNSPTEFILKDNTRGQGIQTFNCQNTATYPNVNFFDSDNIWNNINTQKDQYATDAHFGSMKTYDYYLEKFNRNSIDNQGHPLKSYVHFNLVAYGYSNNNNAFWNGECMTYGDGSNGNTPFTAIDITGHEITHGLTSYTANLNYFDESGALNESFSDIFGTAIEFYGVPQYADWTIGEDVGAAFRSMSNPKAYNQPNTYQGYYWYTGSGDNGGVHYNSGPLNYWFYLLSAGGTGTNDLNQSYTVNSIGIDNAARVAFRTLTVYLNPTSNYYDVYTYGMQAANDLFGACSPEAQSVGNAFYAIGVAQAPFTGETVAFFSANQTESCTTPFTVNFINNSQNSETYFWDFGDGTTSTLQNPVHIYQNEGYYTVKLIANSTNCGIDSTTIADYIIIDASLPCIAIMPTQGNLTIENCYGIIYDAGGPAGNYPDNSNASITIHATGADNIILNIETFDIEAGSGNSCNYDYISFHNGPTQTSPIINNTLYCNTTGNPGTIIATGEYVTIKFHSDASVNGTGFKISYHCEGSSLPPIADFLANTNSCSGWIYFNDKTINNPTSWLWTFGDGDSSSLQNPIHQYRENGIYSVALIATNGFGAHERHINNYIHINMSDKPIQDTSICTLSSEIIINLNVSPDAKWYENLSDTIPVHVGNIWNHPLVTEDKTFYIKEYSALENIAHVGSTNNNTGGGFYGNTASIHYLIFNAYSTFKLKSVLVNAQNTENRTIALRNNSGQIIEQKTVNIPSGISRIQLDMNVPVGINLQLVGLGAPNLYRNNTASTVNYPYIIDGVASIHSCSASPSSNYYYFFYDWEVERERCASTPVRVTLRANPCGTGISDILDDNIAIYPNPTTGNINITGLYPNFDYKIKIVNILGKILLTTECKNDISLNISNFVAGIYFLSIVNKNNFEIKTYKIVKQ